MSDFAVALIQEAIDLAANSLARAEALTQTMNQQQVLIERQQSLLEQQQGVLAEYEAKYRYLHSEVCKEVAHNDALRDEIAHWREEAAYWQERATTLEKPCLN